MKIIFFVNVDQLIKWKTLIDLYVNWYQVSPQLYGDNGTYIFSYWTVRKSLFTFLFNLYINILFDYSKLSAFNQFSESY